MPQNYKYFPKSPNFNPHLGNNFSFLCLKYFPKSLNFNPHLGKYWIVGSPKKMLVNADNEPNMLLYCYIDYFFYT